MTPASASDAQIKIRFGREVHEALKLKAAVNRRSLTREIEYRVIESLPREDADLFRTKPASVDNVATNQGAPA